MITHRSTDEAISPLFDNETYVFCLPGSSGACATGWDKLIGDQLDSRNQPCNLVDLMPRLSES